MQIFALKNIAKSQENINMYFKQCEMVELELGRIRVNSRYSQIRLH